MPGPKTEIGFSGKASPPPIFSTSDFPSRGIDAAQAVKSFIKNININADHPKQDFSSEGLLGLPSLLVGDHQKVIIFSGVGGRQLLSSELKSRGFSVDDCELYNRKCLKDFSTEINRLISKDVLDVVIVHSAELLENLLSQTTPTNLFTLKLLTLLVPSERIRLLAESLGFKKIICSPSASTEQMVSMMRECYSNQS